MGANVISWKRIQQVNRKLGTRFVHAATWEHYVWMCVDHAGNAVEVNIRTLEQRPLTDAESGSSTVHLLRTRDRDNEWLAELDRRQAELVSGSVQGEP